MIGCLFPEIYGANRVLAIKYSLEKEEKYRLPLHLRADKPAPNSYTKMWFNNVQLFILVALSGGSNH
jgi:hypothetical protein